MKEEEEEEKGKEIEVGLINGDCGNGLALFPGLQSQLMWWKAW